MFPFYLAGLKKILNVGKKVVLVISVYLIVLNLFLLAFNKNRIKLANNNPIEKNRAEIYRAINDPETNSTKSGKLVIGLYRLTMCSFIGEACSDRPSDGDKNYKNSLLGRVNNLVIMPYANPPASGVYWAYSGLQNAGFIPKSYAAEGLGFAAIKPLSNIWKVFRDFAYMLLVIVLITIGFMIMFRQKINPQTVISVENALPKVVVSLLLITFSFPIAGLLIDLTYILIIIAISLLSYNGNFYNTTDFLNKYANPDFGTLFFSVWPSNALSGGAVDSLGKLSQALINLIPWQLSQLLRMLSGAIVGAVIVDKLQAPMSNIVDGLAKTMDGVSVAGIGVTAPSIGGILKTLLTGALTIPLFLISFGIGYAATPLILSILIFITIVLLLFRIFFMIFASYIKILMLIIFSPLFLLFEALPGKSPFAYWIKSLVGELITFPVIIVILIVGYIMTNVLPSTGTLWQPPFLADVNPNAYTIFLGMGIIFLIPELVKTVKGMLGVKDMPFNVGLGTFFTGVGTLWGASQAGLGTVSSLTQAPVIGKFLQTSKNPMIEKARKAILPPNASEQMLQALEAAGKIK